MSNKLKVVVTGAAGAGKTRLAIIIEQALVQAEFNNIELIDIDVSDSLREDTKTRNLDTWKASTDVIIETFQLSRQASSAQ